MNKFKYHCNYFAAMKYLGTAYALVPAYTINLEELEPVDEERYYNNSNEIVTYMFCNASKGDVEFLTDHFPSLIFARHTVFDLYVLCIDHSGTSYDYVDTYSDLPTAKCELGEMPIGHSAREYFSQERNIKNRFNTVYGNLEQSNGFLYYKGKLIVMDDVILALLESVPKKVIEFWYKQDQKDLRTCINEYKKTKNGKN